MDVQLPFESEEQLWGAVEYMLDTEGWKSYVIPSLEQGLRADYIALTSPKRNPDVSDDFFRGRIALANAILSGIPMKVREFREKKVNAEILGADGQPIAAGSPYDEANSLEGQPFQN